MFRERRIKASHKAIIWGMFVSPAARGQGIGQQLLNRVLEQACSLEGLRQVNLSVSEAAPAARHLYESLGFRVWGTEPEAIKLGEHYLAESHMILYLSKSR